MNKLSTERRGQVIAPLHPLSDCHKYSAAPVHPEPFPHEQGETPS